MDFVPEERLKFKSINNCKQVRHKNSHKNDDSNYRTKIQSVKKLVRR